MLSHTHFENLPLHNVVTVVEDARSAAAAQAELIAGGLAKACISIHQGKEAVYTFDPDASLYGWRNRSLRRIECAATEEEEKYFREVASALANGQYVLTVQAESENIRRFAAAIIRRHTRHTIYYFGKWVIEELEPLANPFVMALEESADRTAPLMFSAADMEHLREAIRKFTASIEPKSESKVKLEELADTLEQISRHRQMRGDDCGAWLASILASDTFDTRVVMKEFRHGLQEAEAAAAAFVDGLCELHGTLDQEQRQRFAEELSPRRFVG